jgi:hypothetical protein
MRTRTDSERKAYISGYKVAIETVVVEGIDFAEAQIEMLEHLDTGLSDGTIPTSPDYEKEQ